MSVSNYVYIRSHCACERQLQPANIEEDMQVLLLHAPDDGHAPAAADCETHQSRPELLEIIIHWQDHICIAFKMQNERWSLDRANQHATW